MSDPTLDAPADKDQIISELRARVRQLERENERLGLDSLTGLPNRGTLDRALNQEHARADRSSKNWAAVMIDVDHFKLFNDEHGHQAGDKVLRAVGQALGGVVRTGDTAGRYGGEEFMFVLGELEADETDVLEGVATLAERVRGAIEAIDIPGLPQITASVGVAVWLPGQSVDEVVGNADAALYAAKDAGRNAVRVWGVRA